MKYLNYQNKYQHLLTKMNLINFLSSKKEQNEANEKIEESLAIFLEDSAKFDEYVKDLSKEELIGTIKQMTTFNFNFVNTFRLNIKSE